MEIPGKLTCAAPKAYAVDQQEQIPSLSTAAWMMNVRTVKAYKFKEPALSCSVITDEHSIGGALDSRAEYVGGNNCLHCAPAISEIIAKTYVNGVAEQNAGRFCPSRIGSVGDCRNEVLFPS